SSASRRWPPSMPGGAVRSELNQTCVPSKACTPDAPHRAAKSRLTGVQSPTRSCRLKKLQLRSARRFLAQLSIHLTGGCYANSKICRTAIPCSGPRSSGWLRPALQQRDVLPYLEQHRSALLEDRDRRLRESCGAIRRDRES